jgi:hypothetical protein
MARECYKFPNGPWQKKGSPPLVYTNDEKLMKGKVCKEEKDMKKVSTEAEEVRREEIELNDTNNKFWEELIAYIPLIRHGQHRKVAVA